MHACTRVQARHIHYMHNKEVTLAIDNAGKFPQLHNKACILRMEEVTLLFIKSIIENMHELQIIKTNKLSVYLHC